MKRILTIVLCISLILFSISCVKIELTNCNDVNININDADNVVPTTDLKGSLK